MNNYQIWNYIFLSSILVVLVAVSIFFYNQSSDRTVWEEYKGYIVDDEELSGFFPCSGDKGMSFEDVGNTNISKEYRFRKADIREPIYVELIGRIAGEGGAGWGMAGEPWDKNIQIKEVLKIKRVYPASCEARIYPGITVKYDDAP